MKWPIKNKVIPNPKNRNCKELPGAKLKPTGINAVPSIHIMYVKLRRDRDSKSMTFSLNCQLQRNGFIASYPAPYSRETLSLLLEMQPSAFVPAREACQVADFG
jgi:hypothetical protein